MQTFMLTDVIAQEAASSISSAEKVINFLSGKAQVFIAALIIFIVGWYICNFICRILRKTLERSNIETGIVTFINSIAKFGLRALLIIIVVTKLGVDTTSIIALITSASLAVGLALQGSLANFAGGVLILILKPFKTGDYINDSAGHEGTVIAIDIIYTHMLTPDNQVICIPNGTLAGATIINVNKQAVRRIDFPVGVEYSANIDNVRNALLAAAGRCQFTDQTDNPPVVFVDAFDASSVRVVLRIWCPSEYYWDTRFTIQEEIKKVFDERNISIPFDQLDVNIVSTPDSRQN